MTRSDALTVLQADEIRRLAAGEVRGREIAEITGLSIRTVNDVLLGRRGGRHLTPKEQFDLDRQQGWVAACMDPAEWAEWLTRKPWLPDGMDAARPCNDCPLGFAADMRAQGRCNGTPGGVAADPDEPEEEEKEETVAQEPPARPAERPAAIVRLASTPDPDRLKRARDFAERRAVAMDGPTLEIPCGTCLHEPVCALKSKIPTSSGSFVPVEYGDGLRQVITGFRVECDHHIDASRLVAADKPPVAGPRPDQRRGGRADERDREERATRVLAAIARHGGDQRAAAAELGMKLNALVMVVKWAGRSAATKEEIA